MKNLDRSLLRPIVPPLLLASSGFIFCMHWFLLMADNLAAGIASEIIPAPIIAAILAYYSVVFGSMTWLVKIVILTMTLTIILQLFIREIPWFLSWAVALTNIPLIVNGVFYIIPLVGKFISEPYPPEVQSEIVRVVQRSHMLSAYGTAFMILVQMIIIFQFTRQAKAG